MSDMIERAGNAIARELYRQENGDNVLPADWRLDTDLTLSYVDQSDVDLGAVARAALAALREPTEAMLRAGSHARTLCEDEGTSGDAPCRINTLDAWQAMIDTALTSEEG